MTLDWPRISIPLLLMATAACGAGRSEGPAASASDTGETLGETAGSTAEPTPPTGASDPESSGPATGGGGSEGGSETGTDSEPVETVTPLWEMDLDYADLDGAVAADPFLEFYGLPERSALSPDVPAGTGGGSWRVAIGVGQTGGGGFDVRMPQSYPYGQPPMQDTTYPLHDTYWSYFLKFESGFVHNSAAGCSGGSAGLKVHLSSVYPTEEGNGRFDHIHGGDPEQTGFSVNIIGAESGNTHDPDLDPETLLYDGQWHAIKTRRFLHDTAPVFEVWVDGVPIHDLNRPSSPSSLWDAQSFLYTSEFIGTYNCAAESNYPDGLTVDVAYLAHGVTLWSPDNPISGVPDWYEALPGEQKYSSR